MLHYFSQKHMKLELSLSQLYNWGNWNTGVLNNLSKRRRGAKDSNLKSWPQCHTLLLLYWAMLAHTMPDSHNALRAMHLFWKQPRRIHFFPKLFYNHKKAHVVRLIFALNRERKDTGAQSTILLSFIMRSLKPTCPLTEQRTKREDEREREN